MLKLFSILCGVLVIAFGVVETIAANNPNAQQVLCRLWACWDPTVVEDAYSGYLRGSVGSAKFSTDLLQPLIHDAASSFRWCDLGEALSVSGDEERARYCMRRAVALAPNSALIVLRAANVDFRIGDESEGLKMLARVLQLTPEFDGMVFSTFDRFGDSTKHVLELGIPPDRRAAQAFLKYLLANNRDTTDIRDVWNWLRARSFTDVRVCVDYTDYLIRSKHFGEAANVWADCAGQERGDYLQPNRVFNGDFEVPLSGAVLDWHDAVPDGVQLTWDTGDPHTGHRSLRLDFDAQQNLFFNHVYQEVVVQPGVYEFQAFVKSDHVTTDQGIGFHIFDVEAPARLDIAMAPVTGSIGWTRQQTRFETPAQTRLLRIELRRAPSRKFDNKIKGTFWVDSVKLQPASSHEK